MDGILTRPRGLWSAGCLALALAGPAASGQLLGPAETAFSRIHHGWTNYSTAFNSTHDTGASADYATVATLYTTLHEVTLLEYAAILIWDGTGAPDFSKFRFRILVWSDLDAFIQEPRQGNLATWNFAAPTGGSTTIPDATTRGGRPAYELRFHLTNAPVTLSSGQAFVVGIVALAETQSHGSLYVPTASSAGPSDVQAGDLVVGGWRYLVNAGGATIYSGQLAVELRAAPRLEPPPTLAIGRAGAFVRLSWPLSARDFSLEYGFQVDASSNWFPVEAEPYEEEGMMRVTLPANFSRQWFRLRR